MKNELKNSVCLEISSKISPQKMLEFNQSKLTFINQLHSIEGYSSFTEKPGINFQIKICWSSRQALNKFMKTEIFHVFSGAIITLSEWKNIKIINLDKSLNINA